MGLIKNLTAEELRDNPNFSQVKQNLFLATENSYLQGTYVYKNDRIRIDESKYQELLKSANYIANKLSSNKTSVILFHLDSNLLRRFENEKLQKVFTAFN
jgi:hypothetical protein